MASADWRRLRRAFHSLGTRTKPLRAFYQAGGWGRAERELLARLDSGDPQIQHWTPKRATLEAAANAPAWRLEGAPTAIRAFQALGARGATLLSGHTADRWVMWLDCLLIAPLVDGRIVCADASALIPSVVHSSAMYCELLDAGCVLTEHPTPGHLDYSTKNTEHTAAACAAAADTPASRFAALQHRYLEKRGAKLTKKAFWSKCGYKTDTDFRRWLRQDARATRTSIERFERHSSHLTAELAK